MDPTEQRKKISLHIDKRRKELGMTVPAPVQIYPIETVVRIIATGEMAIIKKHAFLKDEKNFLHYEVLIEGREGFFATYPDRIELEALPI